MLNILTVCTGNVCRSPMAAQILATRLAGLQVRVSSAGTWARNGMPMTSDAVALATRRGVAPPIAAAHRAQLLTESHLRDADLLLGMSREHRRAIVELAPSATRRTFTLREFARLCAALTDDDIRAAGSSSEGPPDPALRLQLMLSFIVARRGLHSGTVAGMSDDVVDPYGRPAEIYEQSARESEPGLEAVERIVRLAFE
ncbi:low molecular weight phosphatase family protein [uncultured Microbacterium sp.]|uniref:arsenate reductase/protein-tyrosine-phosphatase family protein n=1 Tax=uncultured Microbacterium sp. TaxID=191216 RepID=UPI0025E17F77|nr:low molecular weight phosphatase family protein [uncultured Microbacterium sp.]